MTDTTHNRHSHTEAYRRGDHSPEALEHEIDEERRSVSQTLEALQEKMSVGGMVDEAWRRYGHYGSDIGRTLGRRVADNPLPLVLTGIGLAWLMMSSGRSGRSGYEYEEDYLWEGDDDLYEEEFVGTRRYGATTRPYGTASVAGPYGSRQESASTSDRLRGAASSMSHRARGAVGSASHGAGSAYGSARDTAGSAAHSASSAAGSAYQGARGAASSASHYAGDAAESASHYAGRATGYASESARGAYSAAGHAAERVGDAARYAGDAVSRSAYEARRRAADYGRYTRQRAGDMMEDHPLVMGALALAVGAAIGGALPRTRVEDEYLGEYSEEAWEAARHEAEKARRVAGAVAEEAQHIAEEKYGEASEHARSLAERARHEAAETAERLRRTAEEEARGAAETAKAEAGDAANRLSETAKEEARRQELGNPKK